MVIIKCRNPVFGGHLSQDWLMSAYRLHPREARNEMSHFCWGNINWFGLVWFILRPCQHDNGYIDGRSQIKVHTDERTQVHSVQPSLAVTHPTQTKQCMGNNHIPQANAGNDYKSMIACTFYTAILLLVNLRAGDQSTTETVFSAYTFSSDSVSLTYLWTVYFLTSRRFSTRCRIGDY